MAFWNRKPKTEQTRSLSLSDWSPDVVFDPHNPDSTLSISTVFAAVSRISSTIACLPVSLYQDVDGNKVKDPDHPLTDLVSIAPNPLMSGPDFWGAIVTSLLLTGNSFVRIVRSPVDASVKALVPLNAARVMVKPTEGGTSLLYFVEGFEEPLSKFDVFHVKGFSVDGIMGISPITTVRETFELAKHADRAAAAAMKNSARPSGYFESTLKFDEKVMDQFLADWKKRHGGTNTGSASFLPQGVKYTPLSMSVEDAGWISSRKFSRTEVSSLFHLPGFMVGELDRATWGNTEALGEDFSRLTLTPWIVRIEKAFNHQVLLPSEIRSGYYIKFNQAALLRASETERAKTQAVQIASGTLSPNEARRLEDRNLRTDPAGDSFQSPLNMRLDMTIPAPDTKEDPLE